MPYVADFRLSVTAALRDQLIATLDGLDAAPLTPEAIATLERRGGVYQLFDGDELVYVGKSASNLPGRLTQHRIKIDGRVGGLIHRVAFRCVYVDEDLDAVAPETLLISRYRDQNLATWNTNGFGNKDPGRNRDRSVVKESHFDWLHPIDLDKPVTITLPDGDVTLADVMTALKAALPYTFRYASDPAARRVLERVDVTDDLEGDEAAGTAAGWMSWLIARLPDDWVIVALPGYLIAYPATDPATYASRTGAWRQVNGVAVYEPHAPAHEAGEVDEPDAEPETPED